MTPRNYTPTIMHLSFNGEDRLCRGKIPITAWDEHSIDNEFSSKLPVCKVCKTVYENKFGRQYIKGKTIATRRARPTNVIRTLNWYHNQCHAKMTNGKGSTI